MTVRSAQCLVLALAGASAAVVLGRLPAPPGGPLETRHMVRLGGGLPRTTLLRPVAKDLVAREAAAGRRSLAEAAALFGALDRLPPALSPAAPAPPGGRPEWDECRTDEERLCWRVIDRATELLEREAPAGAPAAVARLAAEFRALRRGGTIRLPELDTSSLNLLLLTLQPPEHSPAKPSRQPAGLWERLTSPQEW
jgi:hypothetical protein